MDQPSHLTLSVGMPSYTKSEYHVSLTERALKSYASADETIVVEDGTGNWFDADTLIQLKKNTGFTHAVNMVLKVATCDYVAVVNNDTYLVSGDLHDLCIPGTVTTPSIPGQTFTTELKGCFFVIPMNLIPTIGFLDESMRQYYSDQELDDRLHTLGIPIKEVPSVIVHHDQDQTLQTLPAELKPDDKTPYTRTISVR